MRKTMLISLTSRTTTRIAQLEALLKHYETKQQKQ
jgi:hypothetical protein